MRTYPRTNRLRWLFVLSLLLVSLAACNLGAPEDAAVDITADVTSTDNPLATRTLLPTGSVPTAVTVTTIPFPTRIGSVATLPFVIPPPRVSAAPTYTPMPYSIVILSPLPGYIVAGNVQVLGSASHPEFLQYRLEFGPDPNPNNLWFPVTGIVQTPLLNGTLGIWNTTSGGSSDGFYQLRLRVFLRDGSQQTTVVNNIRIQNQNPTPVPSNTPSIPPPIAAFTQDFTQGNSPLVVRFFNQSQGQVSSYFWNFGNGNTSSEVNPIQTFTTPGIYNVTLTVTGPGGAANVARQINVISASAPIAAFTPNKLSGEAPLTVAFTNQSTGNVTSYDWDFGDGTGTKDVNPTHTFTTVGTYNVILKATGPGGSTNVVRQITVVNPQVQAPVANFTANPTSGNTPFTVTFTNQSTGSITNYLWDFNGDGITDSVDKEPTHTYTASGTFTVRLTVIGAGGQNTKTAQVVSQAPPNAPVANFSANPTSGTAPLTVNFTNSTTGDATGYAWDFNNDAQPDSTQTNPSFTYDTAGTYVVTLIATGAGGSTLKSLNISVSAPPPPVQPPVASFTANPVSGNAPLTVNFTNTSTGTIDSLAWDFNNDGTVDATSGNTPSFTYPTAGSFIAKLTVTNAGGTNTATVPITVTTAAPNAPVADFTADPNTGTAPLTVNFASTSTGTIDTIAWDFNGDGTPDDTSDQTPSFTYDNPGTYNITLTVSNAGGSDSATLAIVVDAPAPNAPIAAFTADPTTGDASLTVTFTNTSTGTIDTFAWDFNSDGTPDDTTNDPASFTYDTPGTYNATLTVTNAGGSDSISLAIVVNAPAPNAPVAAFTANPTTGDAPLAVTFTNTSSGTVDTFAWDFNGDGTPDDTTTPNPSFTYDTPGTYNATLTVTNAGGSDSISQAILVNAVVPTAPDAGFSADAATGTAPLTVNFTNQSTGTIDSFAWDFNGDSTPDDTTTQNPSFTYNDEGIFNATLTVTNAGGSDVFTTTITVSAALPSAPVANFTTDVATGAAPLTVNFTNQSSGTVDSLAWDFDGNGSPDDTTSQTPSFSYSTEGTYNATLTVTNAGGSDSISVPIVVSAAAQPPVAVFTADQTSGDAPLTVAFTNASTGTIDSFAWDFNGDGTPDDTGTQSPTFTFNDAGTYNVTLTVNGAGQSDTETVTVTVNAVQTFQPTDEIVYVANVNGNDEILLKPVVGDAINLTNNGANDRQPALSPDGSKIVFVSDRDGNEEIYVLTVGDLSVIRLTDNSANPARDADPVWSPNGSQIAFTSDRNGDNDVFIMNASDGSGQAQITAETSNDQQPAWSPDGNRIAYVTDKDGTGNEIYTMNATDGLDPVRLTNNDKNDQTPAWTSDGSQIVFTSDANGDFDIYVMNASDGSGVTQLTTDAANETHPNWSADNTQITYSRDNTVYIMKTDGTDQTLLFNGVTPRWRVAP